MNWPKFLLALRPTGIMYRHITVTKLKALAKNLLTEVSNYSFIHTIHIQFISPVQGK